MCAPHRARRGGGHRSIWSKAGQTLVVLCATLMVGGCAHLQRPDAPATEDAPLDEIVAALRANAEAVKSLSANFTLLTRMPGEPRRRFQGQLRYRAPEDLYVAAWAVPLGQRAFEVVSRGEYGAVFVPSQEAYFLPRESDPTSGAFDVWLLARRTISQAAWGDLKHESIRVMSAGRGESGPVYRLLVQEPARPARLLEVAGPNWRVLTMEVLGDEDSTDALARVVMGEYAPAGSALLPEDIQLELPGDGVQLDIGLRDVRLGVDNLTDDDFTFQWDSDER